MTRTTVNKFQVNGIASSSGSIDADKIVATDANGVIDRSFLSIRLSPVTTNGAVSYDFTGIPSWATEIQISYAGISRSGSAAAPLFQLGTSGGIDTTTDYSSGVGRISTSTPSTVTTGRGFFLSNNSSGNAIEHGIAFLNLVDSSTNTWAYAATTARSDASVVSYAAGSKALSGVLDRIRLTTDSADTFDGGVISVSYR